jgi:hypothetical protein
MFILKNLCAFASLRETLFIEVSVTGCLKLTVLGVSPQRHRLRPLLRDAATTIIHAARHFGTTRPSVRKSLHPAPPPVGNLSTSESVS